MSILCRSSPRFRITAQLSEEEQAPQVREREGVTSTYTHSLCHSSSPLQVSERAKTTHRMPEAELVITIATVSDLHVLG